jgi:catechol 2,3-dioxygenase-like lactoylglutathione lyase family enzyme
MATLGVSDLERSRTFYGRLGWRGQTVQETVFFQTPGMFIVLWDRDDLAADAGLGAGPADNAFGGIALAHNVRTRSEVDAIVATAESAGAEVTRQPGDTFYGGYAGYFRDPDGYVWEIAWNPGSADRATGRMALWAETPSPWATGEASTTGCRSSSSASRQVKAPRRALTLESQPVLISRRSSTSSRALTLAVKDAWANISTMGMASPTR